MVCHTGARSIPGLADFEEMVITYYLIDSPTQYRYTTTRDVSTHGMDLSVGLGHVQRNAGRRLVTGNFAKTPQFATVNKER